MRSQFVDWLNDTENHFPPGPLVFWLLLVALLYCVLSSLWPTQQVCPQLLPSPSLYAIFPPLFHRQGRNL
jgi:hypothetical protein